MVAGMRRYFVLRINGVGLFVAFAHEDILGAVLFHTPGGALSATFLGILAPHMSSEIQPVHEPSAGEAMETANRVSAGKKEARPPCLQDCRDAKLNRNASRIRPAASPGKMKSPPMLANILVSRLPGILANCRSPDGSGRGGPANPAVFPQAPQGHAVFLRPTAIL
jgi:hypothetical protein